MKKALFIYNPVSGRRRLRYSFDKIINMLSRDYDITIRETHKAGDGTEIVKESLKKPVDAIICCGGDGTLNEVINGVLACNMTVPVGYIPCGSTNDFARSLRIPTNPIAAANNILQGEVVSIDVGLFSGARHFSYIASFGAFTEASYSTPRNMKNALGHLAYVIRGTKDFFELKRCPVYQAEIIPSDAKPIRGEYFFGAVCNSTSVGGLIRLPKSAVDLSDGLFEAIFIRKPQTSKEWFALLDDILHKRIDQNPLVDMCKTENLTIKMSNKTNWTLDGEKMVADTEVSIANQKHAIRLLV